MGLTNSEHNRVQNVLKDLTMGSPSKEEEPKPETQEL